MLAEDWTGGPHRQTIKQQTKTKNTRKIFPYLRIPWHGGKYYMKGPKQKGDFSLENLVYCDEYPSTRGTVRAATRNGFMRLRTVLI